MSFPEQIRYQEAQNLMQTLNRNMAALATLIEGRLSPAEEDILANIFEAQVDLQLLLDDMKNNAYSSMPIKACQSSSADFRLDE